jgi:hypothetical protein
VNMLEERVLQPVEWMYGFVLELGHYFNARAQYEAMGVSYMDTEADAMRRFRRTQIAVRGHLGITKAVVFPKAKPQLKPVQTFDLLTGPGVYISPVK